MTFCAVIATVAVGCGDTGEMDGDGTGDGGNLPEGCDHYVEPGDDDQTAAQEALIEVQEGETVCFASGTYSFTKQLSMTENGVTIRGEGKDGDSATLWDFTDQTSGANGLVITGNDVTVEGIRVENTQGDGVRADSVTNIVFRDVAVIWPEASVENGAYGLYPVQSDGVTVDDCLVVGARDAGIYAGQSTNILIQDSEARDNVLGIEVENSHDAVVRNNHLHGNTGGLLLVDLPGLEAKNGARTNAYGNIIEGNNHENFGEPGTTVETLPPGLGIIVLATDFHEVHGNTVRDNEGAGIVVFSYLEQLFGSWDDPEYDVYPEGNYVHDNELSNNATDPADLVQFLTQNADPAPELIWDGCVDDTKDNSDGSLNNCIVDNGGVTFLDADVCGGSPMPTNDASAVDCMHEPLPEELPFD